MSFLFDNSFWGQVYEIVRVIFLLLDAALLGIFVYAFSKGLEYRPHFSLTPPSKGMARTLRSVLLREKWTAVQEKFAVGSPEAMRLALIEADALADDVLKRLGLEGEHMSDRIGQLEPDEVRTLDRLWRAHRLRNDLVHTPVFTLSANDAERAMGDYEAFLKEVGALE